MLHHFQNVVLILVDQGLEEELLEIFLQREINHHTNRIFAFSVCDLGDRSIRRCGPIEREDPVVVCAARLRTYCAFVVALSLAACTSLRRVSGLRSAASCSARGILRNSRHAGLRSNGMLVSKDNNISRRGMAACLSFSSDLLSRLLPADCAA